MRRFTTAAALAAMFALAAAACGTSVNVTAASDGENTPTETATAEPDAPADDDEAAPTEAPEDEATPEPEEDPTVAPADDEAAGLAAASALIGANSSVGSTDDLEGEAIRCAARALVDTPALFDYVVASPSDDLEDLPPELVDPAVDIVVACLDDATFARLFAEGLRDADLDIPEGTGECFARELDTPDERKAVVKLGFQGDGAVPDPGEFAPVIDAIIVCVPPEVWTEVAVAGMDVPAEMEGALDTACLNDVFGNRAFLTVLLTQALTGDLDSPDITPEQAPLIRDLFDCINFGVALAAEAELDGVTLSQGTIDCLSNQFRELGLAENFIEGTEPSDAELGALVIDCLSTEELIELGGG